ncbi:hypothetical protein [Streptomyces sp. IMTB 1903]|uniref:hypothetical protein n=1 Tax=Streptomyces sp. IMTB 1903 TaxID=1776680 RepID=UPI001F1FF6E8|nr:hypothetical protein [Streptomyces sp. IMTB 1903]
MAVVLPAGAFARVEHGHPEPEPGGGDGGRQPGRPGPDDREVDRSRPDRPARRGPFGGRSPDRPGRLGGSGLPGRLGEAGLPEGPVRLRTAPYGGYGRLGGIRRLRGLRPFPGSERRIGRSLPGGPGRLGVSGLPGGPVRLGGTGPRGGYNRLGRGGVGARPSRFA